MTRGSQGHLPTLAALATPWGRGALAVVRVSGPDCHDVVRAVARPIRSAPLAAGPPRRVVFEASGVPIDDGIAWLQRGPRTYTGEDVAELTLHGNPMLVERLLDALGAAGATPAGPGAFTRRAFEHGKLDLVQAEAVEQTIAATSARGLEAARRAMSGELGHHLASLRLQVVEGIAELEARLDVPGDETAQLQDAELVARLTRVARTAAELATTATAGHHLVHGARVALVGPVNAGKSSLLNALVGRTRALVSPIPGTTRDVIEVQGHAEGLAVTWLDTAGERQTSDPIEAAGLALAKDLVAQADLVVVVARAIDGRIDPAAEVVLERTAGSPRVVVLNGVDQADAVDPRVDVRTIATTSEGVDALRRAVRRAVLGDLPADAVPVVASLHQAQGLRSLSKAIEAALRGWEEAGIVVAAELLHEGVAAIDGLTGADTREEVLDALFSRFCVGK